LANRANNTSRHNQTPIALILLTTVLVTGTYTTGNQVVFADSRILKQDTRQTANCDTVGRVSYWTSRATRTIRTTRTTRTTRSPGATLGPWIYLTFDSCGGTNGNHDVTCNVHDETGITHLMCTVADPAISGGVNVGNCVTNNNKHLQCTIPPTPGVFGCNLQS